MKRILAALPAVTLAFQMTGCGVLYHVIQNTIPDVQDIYPESGATVRADNILGNLLDQDIPEPDAFYSYVKSVQDHSKVINKADNSKMLTIVCYQNHKPYQLSWCGGSVFSWENLAPSYNKRDPVFFKPEEDAAAELRDLMAAYSALGYVFENGGYTIDTKHSETQYMTAIADSIPSLYDETRYYYVDDRTTQFCCLETEGDAFFYMEENSVRTDAVINGSAYTETEEFYEYFTDGSHKAYYRPDTHDVFYPAEQFDGTWEPVPLAKEITEKQYLYSFTVNAGGNEYPVEVWQDDTEIDYCMIENGAVKAMWSLYEGRGMSVMHGFRTDEAQSGEIAEIIEHAESHLYSAETQPHTKGTETISDDKWLQADTKQYGLFDLSSPPRIEKETEPTGVVEEWREYISSGDKPFTLEFRWAGAGRNEYEMTTFDGKNYYYRHDMELHDKTDNLGGEEWFIDGRFFQTTYYTKAYENRGILEWDREETPRFPVDLLFKNEKLDKAYAGMCVRAYEVTIGNDVYICEEWALYLDRLWKVYIKDGTIAAWEGDFYNEPTVNTVLRLEKSADTALLTIPAGAKKHISND